MTRILLLGGTTEASLLARALADLGADTIFSYAGRTAHPLAQPLPTRIGGFGGVEGLKAYLKAQNITHVIDTTHPFAAQMSRNAHEACTALGVSLIRHERPEWCPEPGDIWQSVPDMAGAVAALPQTPARVFLAIGKQNLGLFAARPQHHYVLRLVDAPQDPLPLPDCTVILARGPFALADDIRLLAAHRISLVVAKNAGGTGARAKLDAARAAQIPVIMIQRPDLPRRDSLGDLGSVLGWLGLHPTRLGV